MALKQDAEQVADRAMRIVALIQLRQQTRLVINENEDAGLDVTPAMKQAWSAKIDEHVNAIKTVVANW